jgi:magnesium transporter
MIYTYLKHDQQLERIEGLDALAQATRNEVVWVDLVEPIPEERAAVETFIGSALMTPKDAAEIESSSRYHEEPKEIQLNANFIKPDETGWHLEPVTFALREEVLVTVRRTTLRSFAEAERRRRMGQINDATAHGIFLNIFDARIDLDADITEQLGREIGAINKEINVDRTVSKALLLRIDLLLEKAMSLRENIVDKQRTLSAVLKSERFPSVHRPAVRTLLRDITSLLEHISFGFERLEFLQNTALGLVNIDQNKVIKIFTVATVVFMPPTLIASIYGMNFRLMPELEQPWGYPFAIALMMLSSGGTLLYFKRKGWL